MPKKSIDGIDEEEGRIRVGADYQAVIPDFIEPPDRTQDYPDKALNVWRPCKNMDQTLLDQYLMVSKLKYGYHSDQALALLLWHKWSFAKATADLPRFIPLSEMDHWTQDEEIAFQQGFLCHGKRFDRICSLIPGKNLKNAILYYYLWKKSTRRFGMKKMKKIEVGESDSSNEETCSGPGCQGNCCAKARADISKKIDDIIKTNNEIIADTLYIKSKNKTSSSDNERNSNDDLKEEEVLMEISEEDEDRNQNVELLSPMEEDSVVN